MLIFGEYGNLSSRCFFKTPLFGSFFNIQYRYFHLAKGCRLNAFWVILVRTIVRYREMQMNLIPLKKIPNIRYPQVTRGKILFSIRSEKLGPLELFSFTLSDISLLLYNEIRGNQIERYHPLQPTNDLIKNLRALCAFAVQL